MGSNRVIDADNDVIIKGITWPSSDGNADQIIKTNGSGTLSFTDDAGGTDTVASAAEAASYTGTSRIIYITANEAVTFSTNLKDRIIIMDKEHDLKFQDCSLKNCIIQHYDHIIFENTASASSAGGAIIYIENCKIQTFGKVEFLDNKNSAGEKLTMRFCSVRCSNFKATNINTESVVLSRTSVDSTSFLGAGSATYHWDADVCRVDTSTMYGGFDLSSCNIKVASGSTVLQTVRVKAGSVDVINSMFPYPFEINGTRVSADVNFIGSTDAGLSLPTGANTTVIFEDEAIDTAGSYNSSTGIFTAPIKGVYQVDCTVLLTSTAGLDLGEIVFLNLAQDSGSPVQKMVGRVATAYISTDDTLFYGSHLSGSISLNAGDEIFIRLYQNSGGTRSIHTNNEYHNLSISKIN